MKVGRVTGNVVSTINHEFFDGESLLICRILDRGKDTDRYLICTDRVGAGVDETVLILDEGSSARQIYGIDTGPIRSVIVGIVDDVTEEAEGR
ncbi:MAG: EutN/CcmL family microcompartment protein [Acidimicrobiia bacterium]|nr:MAG: EutN/CcmL family microcompartment protein [Acidimicrobiia bacterium]